MTDTTNVTKRAEPSRPEPSRPEPSRPEPNRNDTVMMPPVDVVEDANGITLYADLPGVPKDKLSLHVEADTLSIEGEVILDTPDGLEVGHAEVSLPRFRREFTLSKELDSSKIGAEFNQGVLKLRIPKAEHLKPRRVEVKVG